MAGALGTVLDYSASILKNTGPLLAALGLGKLVLDTWRKGVGRRRHWLRNYRRLALGVRIAYVTDLFGEPAYQTKFDGQRLGSNEPEVSIFSPAKFIDRIWVLADDAYLQVQTDEDDTVVRYSLTTCSRRFKPKLKIGTYGDHPEEFSVRLGVTRFGELPWLENGLQAVYRNIGNTAPHEYGESYSYGRRGGYQVWVCAYSSAGVQPFMALPMDVPNPPWPETGMVDGWCESLSKAQRQALEQSRAGTVVNTLTVDDFRSDRSELSPYAVSVEQVRLMPTHPSWWGQRIIRAIRRGGSTVHARKLPK